jgi:peptidyl-prolyl cis-trans isomerase SurA
MKAVFGVFMVCLPLIILIGGCAPKYSDEIVLQVGPSSVTLGEYEKFFNRNSTNADVGRNSSMEEREHFLDLLTNYKLKLQDAYDKNLINDPEVTSELKEYRSSLASTFIIEKDITEPGIQKMYNRKKEEVRTQFLLLKIPQGASPEDTLTIYKKGVDIIRRAEGGESFDSLVVNNSDEPTAKTNKGDTYYFTAGQVFQPLEDVAYTMKKGEVTKQPLRTSAGYLIVKILDRQPSRGSISVSHIMTRFQKSRADTVDTLGALSRITGLMDSLRKGWDFHKLAEKYSDDATSAVKGGELGWFERRRFVQPFDEAAFNLKVGAISGIVKTPFGYHIICCDSAKPLAPLASIREDIKKMYVQQRYNNDYAAYIAQLKKDFNYSFSENTYTTFVSKLDSNTTTDDSSWVSEIPSSIKTEVLMMINGQPITVDSVATRLASRPENKGVLLRYAELKPKVEKISEQLLLIAKSAGLETRNPEFAALMKEYSDGIVLYKAEQMEVWSKTTVSDTALMAYYENHKEKYMFPERVNIQAMMFHADTLAFMVYDSLKSGVPFAEAAQRYPDFPPPKNEDGSRGLEAVDTDELTKQGANLGLGEYSEPFALEDGSWAIVKLIAKEPSRQKSFEEAGAEVSNNYQEEYSKKLEQQWLERIRKSHIVTQHKELLNKVFQEPVEEK